MKKKRPTALGARQLSDAQIADLLIQLGAQLQEVALRGDALRIVVERHGIPHEEIDQVYTQLREAAAVQLAAGLKRALYDQILAQLATPGGTKQ